MKKWTQLNNYVLDFTCKYMKKVYYIHCLSLLFSFLYSIPLQDMYDNAGPNMGYDKYIELEFSETYTGSIGIYDGSVCINGNGATIDLQNENGIWIYSDDSSNANLDIKYSSIINGAYHALSYSGNATGNITNCNFINNDFGIKVFDTCNLNITNCNFINNNSLGLGMIGELTEVELSYSNFWNNGNNIQENCPGWGSIWTPWEYEDECFGLLEDNPLFVDVNNENYEYLSNSPCIDSGNPNLFDPDNTISDIGAIFYNQYDNCLLSGDVNNDNTINILDVVEMINYILFNNNEELECYDINNDGLVNILDVVYTVNVILDI